MNTSTLESAAVFAVCWVALFVGHQVGDHWGQTSRQAAVKGGPGWASRWACAEHVLALIAVKALALTAALGVTGLTIRPAWLFAGLGVDAASHYWADRRTTLRWLANAVGKGEFFDLGAPRPGKEDQQHLGTGAYALDQSWHILWLFITALIIAH